MSIPLTPASLLFFAAVVLVAGAVNGLAGFGFAVVATMVLAVIVDPAVAVVFVIIPILAVNLSLVRELSPAEARRCSRTFAPLLVPALIGTIIGMAVLDLLPADPLRVLLGLLTLAFVLSLQNTVPVPGLARAKDRCFVETTPAMIAIGGVSGLLFGATNVGVQLVAYLRSCNLQHKVFVGVVALVFVGINGVRVVAAGAFGLYADLTVLWLSMAAAVPAVAGVAIGKRVRVLASERARKTVVLGLLTIIGFRLLAGGLGLV